MFETYGVRVAPTFIPVNLRWKAGRYPSFVPVSVVRWRNRDRGRRPLVQSTSVNLDVDVVPRLKGRDATAHHFNARQIMASHGNL
jgi:hypothetical protein